MGMKSLQCIPETEENTITVFEREEPGGHETEHFIMLDMHVAFRRSD